jgi:hypothetical protein
LETEDAFGFEGLAGIECDSWLNERSKTHQFQKVMNKPAVHHRLDDAKVKEISENFMQQK